MAYNENPLNTNTNFEPLRIPFPLDTNDIEKQLEGINEVLRNYIRYFFIYNNLIVIDNEVVEKMGDAVHLRGDIERIVQNKGVDAFVSFHDECGNAWYELDLSEIKDVETLLHIVNFIREILGSEKACKVLREEIEIQSKW